MIARTMLILALAVVLPAEALAQDKKDDALDKAKAAVEKQVQDWKGAGFKTQVVEEKYVREMFPNHVLVAVHFPLWPVARKAPEPMNSQNLFAVAKDGKVTHLADSKMGTEEANAEPPSPGTSPLDESWPPGVEGGEA